MPKRSVEERIKDFSEVALGFSKEEAEAEANRCLECENPACVKGCPVEVDIPAFIKLIKQKKTKQALEKIKEKNNLPAICGRVCPQENQCEARCVLNKKKAGVHPVRNSNLVSSSGEFRNSDEKEVSNGVNIVALERYAADYGSVISSQLSAISKEKLKYKIAVVGSGPAGLACAADLAKMGYSVTVFESLHLAGGVLVYGIPEFRLPKEIVQKEIKYITSLGVTVKTDVLIGRTLSIEDLFNHGFNAVFVATGAGLPEFLGIEGENLGGVYSANEFLTRVNLMNAWKFPEYATPLNLGRKIAVIGGGNVAFDCARTALRLTCMGGGFSVRCRGPAKAGPVVLLYRRSENEMPARKAEIENAKEEGVALIVLAQPIKILGGEKGFVKGIECIKMELGEPDSSGRSRPLPIENSNFVLNTDTVIVAIGQRPNPLLPELTTGLAVHPDGTIKILKPERSEGMTIREKTPRPVNYMTSIKGVFAGGDIVTGADTVISAMGAGKKAAVAIDKYLFQRRERFQTVPY